MMERDFDVVVIGGGIVGTAIAESATERGLRAALVEIGPAALDEQQPARPSVVCRGRTHSGCVAARNHVLGGNGHYWGGGLMRPPSVLLEDCLGVVGAQITGSAADLGAQFAAVERRLGLRAPPARTPAASRDGIGDRVVAAEIFVLPGRFRNVSATRLARLRASSLCKILTKAAPVGFDSEAAGGCSRIRALWVEREGVRSRIVGRRFVLAAGVVDSNLIVQRFGAELLPGADTRQFGHGLHDHWSVPIADVCLKTDGDLRKELAPRFRDGLIVGTHYELTRAAPGWGARGFLHFTFAFDEVSPYRDIKNLMLLRQQKARLPQLLGGARRLLSHWPALVRIGAERFFTKRLFLADGIRATLTLDFESFPHIGNALQLDGEQAILDWEIREEDEASFLGLLADCRNFLRGIEQRYAVRLVPRFDLSDEQAALSHYRDAARDAYHLGGGLAAGSDTTAVDFDLRLRGTSNLYILSSAVFARPGLVNPTLCLLALADRLTKELSKGS